jgi:hypothetical protein
MLKLSVSANTDTHGGTCVPEQEPTYNLNDGELLARLMRCPDKGGQRHTVRSLSAATGISKSKISSMINDRQTQLPESKASATARAVGVRRKALFTPTTSAYADTDNNKEGER